MHDDLPEEPEWGAAAPSMSANISAAARRRDDLRAVALARRYTDRFTGDDVLRTNIAVNALQQRYPAMPRHDLTQMVVDLVAYASRAYTTWMNEPAAERLALEATLGRMTTWHEVLRLRAMGIAFPDEFWDEPAEPDCGA